MHKKIKNAFSPYINLLNIKDKQAKIDLNNAKIQDINNKKAEREKESFSRLKYP